MRCPVLSLSKGLAVLVLLVALPASAQGPVPSPAQFLGYELGTRFVPHDRVVAYVEAVAAAAPDRVVAERYGQTYEGRPLLTVTVTSRANRARLDAIRAANVALTRGEGTPAADHPAVVWMSYNVHGNEAVSSNAALDVLYRLLTDPEAGRWLENTVVVLDPCINPDGYNRYVSWVTQMTGAAPNAAPEAREHREPWPGGRPNHYLFDLNRDWAWGTQAETRQRVVAYRRWMPHIHADYHEQGVDAPYYFAPAAEPFHPAITPWQRELQTRIGHANARTFDARGELYFTREVFDLFYPSYGDTWPTFNGAVGMTYEQGGSGRAGLAIETAIGDTLTLGDRIANHVATSLNNVAVAARERAEVVSRFADYFAPRGRVEGSPYRAYVVRAANGPARLAALARVLDHNGIAYGRATARVSGDGYDYRTGKAARVTAEAGDLVVRVDQPAGRLASVLFEPEPALSDSLTYDVTAWALPFAHGLDAVALRTDVPVTTASAPFAPAVAAPSAPAYAYAIPWTSLASARALARLHRAGVRVRSSGVAFEQNGRRFAPGTVLATRADNARLGARFDALVAAAAAEAGAESVALATGGAARGADLGSGNVSPLRAPRIVVATGPSVASTALGEVWHTLDEGLGISATLVDAEQIDAAVLARADVLVLPAGRYARAFDDADMTAIGAWIEGGGTVVALESAAGLFAGREGYGLARKDGDAPRDTLATFGERERRGLSQAVPGAVYRVTLDATHPLAFGYEATGGGSAGTSGAPSTSAATASVPTLWRSDEAFAYLARGWNVGTLRGDARLAGFTGSAIAPRLRDALVYGVEEKGAGAVVYLLDGPLFRGFWEGTHLVFANAILRF